MNTLDIAILKADKEAEKKLRRQIEDYLRKYATLKQLQEIHKLLIK